MDVFFLAVLFGPGVIASSILWRQFSRSQQSFRYWAIAWMTTLAGFIAVESMVLFTLAWWMNAECESFRECHPWISKETEFPCVVVSCLCIMLSYGGLTYRKRRF
jgi:hypothetical protein